MLNGTMVPSFGQPSQSLDTRKGMRRVMPGPTMTSGMNSKKSPAPPSAALRLSASSDVPALLMISSYSPRSPSRLRSPTPTAAKPLPPLGAAAGAAAGAVEMRSPQRGQNGTPGLTGLLQRGQTVGAAGPAA